MTRYAIVNSNIARHASKKDVEAHAKDRMGGNHPFATIVKWDESTRNSIDIYTVQNGSISLEPYQRKSQDELIFQNGVVTQQYVATNVDLDSYKTRRVTDAWIECEQRIQSGVVTIQSNTDETPVDHTMGTDTFTISNVWQSKTIAINDGHITSEVRLKPKGELDRIAFTIPEFQSAARAAHDRVDALMEHYFLLKKQILVAATHEDVAAVDITAGWP